VTEEREGESGVVADAAEALVDDLGGLADGVRAQVGELGPFQVAPHLFDGVEVIGVGREAFDHQPVTLALDEPLHGPTAVGRQAVPDEGGFVAVEVAVELEQEVHDGLVVVGARLHGKYQGSIGPAGREAHGRRHRESLPVVQVVTEHRGLAPRSPGGPHRAPLARAFFLPGTSAR
jgi:hypothetical protein